MLGTSLRHRGDELLALPGGPEGYRAGDVTGLPLVTRGRTGSERAATGPPAWPSTSRDLSSHRGARAPDPRHDDGYPPSFRLPGASRDDVRLRLPARRHRELDGDRELALTGGGRRLVLRLDEGYRDAQAFAHRGADFACLEPMTAPVNALIDARYSLVAPGGSYTARFTLLVEDVS